MQIFEAGIWTSSTKANPEIQIHMIMHKGFGVLVTCVDGNISDVSKACQELVKCSCKGSKLFFLQLWQSNWTAHYYAGAIVLNILEIRLMKVRVSDMKAHNICVSRFLYIHWCNENTFVMYTFPYTHNQHAWCQCLYTVWPCVVAKCTGAPPPPPTHIVFLPQWKLTVFPLICYNWWLWQAY